MIAEWLNHVDHAIQVTKASAIAIGPITHAPYEIIRQLFWRTEGRELHLRFSPGALGVESSRLSVRPAAGLPLLHLDEGVLSKSQRAAKCSLAVLGSPAAFTLFANLCWRALAVGLTSRVPVIYKQEGRLSRTHIRYLQVQHHARQRSFEAKPQHFQKSRKNQNESRHPCQGKNCYPSIADGEGLEPDHDQNGNEKQRCVVERIAVYTEKNSWIDQATTIKIRNYEGQPETRLCVLVPSHNANEAKKNPKKTKILPG